MRKFWVIGFFLMSCPVFGQDSILDIHHLTGNFYVCTTYMEYKGSKFPANCMYVLTDSGALLIDSPWDTTQTLPLLDSIRIKHNKEVKFCVATHYHDDRTGGFDILKRKGIKTYSSVKTFSEGKKAGEKTAEFVFVNDTTFTLGEISFQTFFPGHGHTPDNIVIWFPKAKVLYGGCFIKSVDATGMGNVADADVNNWPIAIKKTMKKFKSPKFVIPGHQSWGNKNALIHTLYLLTVKEK